MAVLGYNPTTPASAVHLNDFPWAMIRVQATENGTIDDLNIYIGTTASGRQYTLGIWEDSGGSPGNLLCVGAGASTSGSTGYQTQSVSGSPSIVSGNYYWLGGQASGTESNLWGYDSTTNQGYYRNSGGDYSHGSLIDPFAASPTSISDFKIAIYANYTPASSDTLTITSPVQYQTYQRNGSDQASIAISGTYSGTPTAIEASFNGGAYATIDASPSAGTFSGTLSNQAAGQGTLTVRFTNDTGVSDTVADVGIGDVFLVIGDSIAEGRGTNAQSYTGTPKATCFRQDDAWANGNDPIDTGTSSGSHWPILATRIMDDTGYPVAFVTCATGSTDVAGTNNQWASGNSAYTEMQSQATAYGGTFKGILCHWGPNAVASSLSQATYNAALDTFISNVQTDIQAGIKLCLGIFGEVTTVSGNMDELRAAIIEAWGDNASILLGPNLIDQDYSDGVHPSTDSQLTAIGNRWWAALDENFYGGSSGRGPVFSSAHFHSGNTTIDVIFDKSLKTGLTFGTGAWQVADSGGPITVNSVAYNPGKPDRVLLSLASAGATGSTSVTFGSDNDAAGVVIPLGPDVTLPGAAGTVNLPAEPFYLQSVSATPDLSGTVTLSATGVQNAKVYVINATSETLEGVATTDVNGDWVLNVEGNPSDEYVAVVAYETGGTQYTALGKPFLTVS